MSQPASNDAPAAQALEGDRSDFAFLLGVLYTAYVERTGLGGDPDMLEESHRRIIRAMVRGRSCRSAVDELNEHTDGGRVPVEGQPSFITPRRSRR